MKEDPAEVVRRYESGHFASSDLCFREYMKALVMTNKIDKVDLAKTLQQTSEVAGMIHTYYSYVHSVLFVMYNSFICYSSFFS